MSKKNKIRIDQLLVEKGLAPTRTRAQSFVMSGQVYVGTQKINKPSELFPEDTQPTLKGKDHPFVGRGGVKLAGALDHFQIEVKDFVCLDIGCSTGGFTDCLLKRGAQKVIGIDVGYGQLDYSLRNDPRVLLFEQTNFRNFDVKLLPLPLDFVCADVSFISLKLILPKIKEALTQKTQMILLAKPQFEVGRNEVGKGGIVKDPEAAMRVVEELKRAGEELGFEFRGSIPSPILGRDGNQEFLLNFSK